jgi:hypothetical protein
MSETGSSLIRLPETKIVALLPYIAAPECLQCTTSLYLSQATCALNRTVNRIFLAHNCGAGVTGFGGGQLYVGDGNPEAMIICKFPEQAR